MLGQNRAGEINIRQFVENVDYEVLSGSFGTHVLRSIKQGMGAHADRPLYAARPDGSRLELPIENRQEAILVLIQEWLDQDPHQTSFGVSLDPGGLIGVDTIETR